MEYILTSSEMKMCDRTAIDRFGIGSPVLMERAALQTVRVLTDRYGTDIRVGIMAGSGNNGGDGIAMARILQEGGIPATIHIIGDPARFTPETAAQFETARKLNIPICYGTDQLSPQYDVIVDAVFGIGLTRSVDGKYKDAIESMNASGAHIVAVDIPSGVNADNGTVMGCAVKADLTVTFAYRKLGLMLYPGAAFAGEVVCVPIGIPGAALPEKNKRVFTYADAQRDLKLPDRNPSGNKGTFGKALLIAGSRNMGGACHLSALGAFRTGAGMVRIFTASDNRESLLKNLPEAIVDCYGDDGGAYLAQEEAAALTAGIAWASVVAIGPGLSLSGKAKAVLETTLACCDKPMVIDADALNILAQNEELLKKFEHGNRKNDRDVIFTPHLGEFSRLTKHSVEAIKKDIMAECRAFAERYDVTLVCKDARTVVSKCGMPAYLNFSGNDGMATAGSGDVLTGITAGLLAQDMGGFDAAVMGTYVHGLAGDTARDRTSARYIMAQDIIQSLQYLI